MEWLLDWIQGMKDKLEANYNQHKTYILVAAGLFMLVVILLIF